MILVGLLRHNLTSLMASQPKTDAKAIRETYVTVVVRASAPWNQA